jgi:hypothetical protein
MRPHQLDTYNYGFDSGNDEKNQSVEDVKNAQALVIDRGHPLMQRLNPWPARNLRGLNGHRIR